MKRYGVTLGTSLPFRLTFERNCLAQGKRLPGEKSSLLGFIIINKPSKLYFLFIIFILINIFLYFT